MFNLLEVYSNSYKTFRQRFPNVYIVCISILVSFWFHGMFQLIRKYFTNNDKTNLLLMIIPVVIMYLGDGKLEEIYNFEGLQKRVAAIQRPNISIDGGDGM